MKEKAQEIQTTILNSEIKPETLLRQIHSIEGRVADTITNFSGSMPFVYFHVIWFTLWVLINKGVFESIIPAFDPFPYGLLTMIVSLEAIFLSTFIMITQNRQALIETYRELEEDKEEQEQEEEVEDIQEDLDEIKRAITLIQNKVVNIEKAHPQTPNGTTPKA